VHDSGALIRSLLEHELVDEMQLIIVPVILGQGARLFPDADIALDLVDSRTDSKGVTIQVYRPNRRRSTRRDLATIALLRSAREAAAAQGTTVVPMS
jgi:RibD C-terminal domain